MDQLLKYFSVSVSQWHSCPNGDGEKSQPTQVKKTSQELRMLSSVTINSQITKIVMISGSQLIVRIVISVSNVTSLRIVFVAIVNNYHICHKCHKNPREILEKSLRKS